MSDDPTYRDPSVPPSSGINLTDIYYVVFRHKWKIALISALGIVTAVVLPLVWPLPYQSEAKLLVRYVVETKSPGQVGANDSKVKSPDERGETVINTELEILTSLDLAQEVAAAIGPEKILPGGRADAFAAGGLIRRNLTAEVTRRSSVIRVTFEHPNPQLVQPVLNQLIESYLKRHGEIHRAVGVFDEFLTKETDQLRSRLERTEQELRRAKTNAGIISIEDTKKVYSEQIPRLRQAIFDAEAELADRRAAASELTKLLRTAAIAPTNDTAVTNEVAVPPDKIAEYRKVCGLLDRLAKSEQDLLLQFTPESSLVQSVEEQMVNAQRQKRQLESEHPGLLAVAVLEPKSGGQSVDPRTAVMTEQARVSALEARIRVLNGQLEGLRKEATAMDVVEVVITELQRKKELEEQHYKYFAANLEQSRIDEALGPGRVSNISKIQSPSPPFRDNSKLRKVQKMLLFGGLAGALVLGFLIDLLFDRSIKRPIEIERKLGLPLFLSIPLMARNGKTQRLKGIGVRRLLPRGTSAAKAARGNGAIGAAPGGHEKQAPAPSEAATPLTAASPELPCPASALPGNGEVEYQHIRQMLGPFNEALRDRLMVYFEVRNLTHKPKLVAVTSCAEGSGVTTVATGLAAALSETGDGNVLLVDMHSEHGAAHHFYKGHLACGLDEALEAEKRSGALVQDNLYVVAESTNGDKLPRVLPKRFTHLVPRLKTSDYDYIIFDMPPISQISVTPKLARFMDMVLLVIESEKTDRDLVKHAASLVSEPDSNIGVVLNKCRAYVPQRLQQQL